MKIGFLIVGRLKSTRLAKKILLPVLEEPFLAHMFRQIRQIPQVSEIILCTSTHPEDDPLPLCAKEQGVSCFRGSEDDVIKRLHDAAVFHQLDYILTITADCPLVSYEYAQVVLAHYQKTNADLITAFDLPHGAYCYGMKPSALAKVMDIKEASDTEVWGRYFFDTGLFHVEALPVTKQHQRPDLRMTLDYPQDYEFFKKVIEGLSQHKKAIALDDIITFCDAHPEVPAINRDCAQQYLVRYTRQSEIKLRSRFETKRAVLLGCGSIGQRHARHFLNENPTHELMAYRTYRGHTQALPKTSGITEVNDWAKVEGFKPDIAIIANPTSEHVESALKVLPLVKGILIEKPISHQTQGINNLIQRAQENKVVLYVGYNLRKHPIIKHLSMILEEGKMGALLNAQSQVGHWLPDWHPYEDYRQSYAARKDLGGGVALTLIHEINVMTSLLGSAQAISAINQKHEALNLDVDVLQHVMISHAKGAVSQLLLNYIQKPMTRLGTWTFERGVCQYDLKNNWLKIITPEQSKGFMLWQDESYDLDQSYREQMSEFLRYTREGRLRHPFDAQKGYQDVSIVEAMLQSASTKQMIWLE